MRPLIDVMHAVENIIPDEFARKPVFTAGVDAIIKAIHDGKPGGMTTRWEDFQRLVIEILPRASGWPLTANRVFSGGEDYTLYLPRDPASVAQTAAIAPVPGD
ncbi:MAG: hypothetical protein P4M15_02245 [Alphaproteobacteria bacterium]|nr:hypothetical protein [Alphaproteobacteria bacterium]